MGHVLGIKYRHIAKPGVDPAVMDSRSNRRSSPRLISQVSFDQKTTKQDSSPAL